MHTHGGGFTVFESGDAVGLPLIHLSRATLRGANGQKIQLEFSSAQVVIEGESLAELFGHVLDGRVKVVRRGRHESCVVAGIQILDV